MSTTEEYYHKLNYTNIYIVDILFFNTKLDYDIFDSDTVIANVKK